MKNRVVWSIRKLIGDLNDLMDPYIESGFSFMPRGNQRLSYIDPYQFPESDDMLIYWDSVYYMATMMVGQYFGCVHFSRRE